MKKSDLQQDKVEGGGGGGEKEWKKMGNI